jgi:hypothetical protein
MVRPLPLLAFVILAGALPMAAHADDALSDLLNRVPEGANALIILRVDDAFNSPLGKKEQWAQKHAERYQVGSAKLPPNVQMAVLAAQLEPQTLNNTWEAGLIQLKDPFTLEMIASQERGQINDLADQKVVWSPRNFYAAQLAPNRLAVFHPANRQEASRWLRAAKGRKSDLSPYLHQASKMASAEKPVVMAIDLTDMLEPKLVGLGLGKAKALEGKNADMNQLIPFVTSLKGLTFSGRLDATGIVGELRLDFGQSAEPFKAYLKPLLLEALMKVGASYPELDNWNLEVQGNVCTLRSRIKADDLRQILSIVHPPLPSLDQSGGSPGDASAKGKASLRYFREVSGLVSTLDSKLKNAPSYLSYETSSLWHDKYAKQIDQLPILDVDPELVAYGADMSMKLRAIGASLKGNQIDKSQLEASKYSTKVQGGWNYYSGYSGSAYYDNHYQVNQEMEKVRAEGNKSRVDVWLGINEETAALRRKMTEKYGVEF